MNQNEIYVVCQFEDYNLKIMANRYINNEIQVIFKEIINENIADNGVIVDINATSILLKAVINKISALIKQPVLRIAISLPTNDLTIYQSQAVLDFQETNHKISNNDIIKTINMSQNIDIDQKEVICLTKPYNFKVDNYQYQNQSPINAVGKTLFIETLIYTLPKKVYDSQLAVIKNANLELLSISIDQFALAFNINAINTSYQNLVLIDWNYNTTKISLFANFALYATNNIKIGFNQLVQLLMQAMHCSYDKAERFLTKIINVNSNSLEDVILNTYFDSVNKRKVVLTKNQLSTIVKNQIDDIIKFIYQFMTETLINNNNISIVMTGKTTSLPGFVNYLKKTALLKDAKFIVNQIPGANSYEWATLIGTSYYQHSLNLYSNIFLTSVNKDVVTSQTETIKTNLASDFKNDVNLNYQ